MADHGLVQVGKVLNIIDESIVVESFQTMPPLDLDTVLFKSDGKQLGLVCDVFGPIKSPYYSIKFNSVDHLKEAGVDKEMAVFFVPQTERTLTKFAFVEEIRKIKGTDASWEDDKELPEEMMEYSDDEEEQLAKRNRRNAAKISAL